MNHIKQKKLKLVLYFFHISCVSMLVIGIIVTCKLNKAMSLKGWHYDAEEVQLSTLEVEMLA